MPIIGDLHQQTLCGSRDRSAGDPHTNSVFRDDETARLEFGDHRLATAQLRNDWKFEYGHRRHYMNASFLLQAQNVHSRNGPVREQSVLMIGYGKKIREQVLALKLSEAAVARSLGLSEKRFNNYVNEEREPDFETLLHICDRLKITPNELFNIEYGDQTAKDREVQFAEEYYAPIGVYDIRASAGPGAVVAEDSESHPLSYQLFRRTWLRSIAPVDPRRLVVIEVSGDSMEATLYNGDQVLVDRTVRTVGRDAIYVLRLDGGELQVKRCTRHPRSKLIRLTSDNSKYEPKDGIRDRDIDIVGRVVWLGRNVGG